MPQQQQTKLRPMKPMPVAGAGMGGDKNANVMGWEKLSNQAKTAKPMTALQKAIEKNMKAMPQKIGKAKKKKAVAPSYSKIQKSIQKSMGYK